MIDLVLAAWLWLSDGSLAWCDDVWVDHGALACVTAIRSSSLVRYYQPGQVEVIEFQVRRRVHRPGKDMA